MNPTHPGEVLREDFAGRFGERVSDPKAWTYALTADHLTAIPGLGEAGKSGTAATINSDGVAWIVQQTMPEDFAKRWESGEARYFDSNPNQLVKTGRGIASAGKAFKPDLTAEERADAVIDTAQALGTIIPGAAVAAQAANVAEAGLGAFNTAGGSLSDADRVKRIKARHGRLRRELEEIHGPTMKPTGKTTRDGKPVTKADKEIARRKQAALADRLRAKALDAVNPSKALRKAVAKVMGEP